MLANLYRDEPKPLPSPHEEAILPVARLVRDEWMHTVYRGPADTDNLTQETYEKRDEYRSLMLKEPAVSAAFWSRIASVMTLVPKVHAQDPDNPAEVDVANFVKDAIGSCQGGWPHVIGSLAAGGLLDGFAVCEMVFDFPERGKWRNKRWVLKEFAPLDGRFIRFDIDSFKRVVGVRGLKANAGQVFNVDRFAIYSHQQLFNNPFGISQFRSAYRAAKMMESAIKLRIILLQNFTGPFVAFKSASPETRASAMRIVANARSQGFLVCDKNDDFTVTNMASGSDSEFQSAMDDLRKEMYTAICWGYLPFVEGREGSELGNSTVQKSITELGTWRLATGIAEVINRYVVPPLVRNNIADETINFPVVALGGQNTGDKKSAGDIFELAKRLGVPLSKKQVQRALDLEEPNGPEDDLRELPQGGAGGNPFAGMSERDGGFPPDAGGAPPGGSPVPDGGAPMPEGDDATPAAPGQPHGPVDLSRWNPRIGKTDTAEMDRAAMIAILDLQARAHRAGSPGRFQKAIDALRAMIGNHPAMHLALAGPPDQSFGWHPEQTRTGGIKAINTENPQYILYGEKAKLALNDHPDKPKVAQESHERYQGVLHAKSRAQELAAKMVNGGGGNSQDYKELAGHVQHLSINEIHAVRKTLMGSFSNVNKRAEMVSALSTYALRVAGESVPDALPGQPSFRAPKTGVTGAGSSPPPASPPPAPSEPSAPTPSAGGKGGAATGILKDHLDASEGLSPAQWDHYHGAIDRATAKMPAAAHARIEQNLQGATFHAKSANIGDALYQDCAEQSPDPAKFADLKGQKIGVGYCTSKGTLHIDGDLRPGAGEDKNPERFGVGKYAPAHEVYAHALGRVIDGPNYELSSSKEWGQAFADEIAHNGAQYATHKLSRFASMSPEQGFAEFSRLVYGSKVPVKEVAERFPQATAFFQKQGLLPDSEASTAPASKGTPPKLATVPASAVHPPVYTAPALSEAFDKKVIVAKDGSHVDTLKPLTEETPKPVEKKSPFGRDELKAKPPAQGFNIGADKVNIQFDSVLQQRLNNLGEKQHRAMKGSRVSNMAPEVASLAAATGRKPLEIRMLANDVHRDIRGQMKGVKGGETRTVVDNHDVHGEKAKAPVQAADDAPAKVLPARTDPNPGEAIPPAPVAAKPPTAFDLNDHKALASAVHDAASQVSDMFGKDANGPRGDWDGHKVLIGDTFDQMKKSGKLPESATLDQFKDSLAKAHAGGAVQLSRLDMPQIFDQRGGVNRWMPSEIQHPAGGTFHAINVPGSKITPRTDGASAAPALAETPHAKNDLLDAEMAKPDVAPPTAPTRDLLGEELAKPAEQPKATAPDLNDEVFGKPAAKNIGLKKGGNIAVSHTFKTDPDGTHRYVFAGEHGGKKFPLGNLDVFDDERGESGKTSHYHPEVPKHLRRQGVAASMYEHAADLAGKHGGVLKATDDLTDDAQGVWEHLENKGTSNLWSIDRRPKADPAASDAKPAAPAFAPGTKETAESVLERVKASPNQPADRDWDAHAQQHGIEGDFTHVEIPTKTLTDNVFGGHLRRSNSVDQNAVDKKVASGERNPVLITREPGRGSLVVDGNHSLAAAMQAGDPTVQAIVSEKSALHPKGDEPGDNEPPIQQVKGKRKTAAVGDSLGRVVASYGGIDPKSLAFLAHYSGAKEAVENGLPPYIFKNGGRGLDELAQELHTAGHISVPGRDADGLGGDDPGAHLLEQIANKAKSHHADLSDHYEKALQNHWKLEEEARKEHEESHIAEANRVGQAAGASTPQSHLDAETWEEFEHRGEGDATPQGQEGRVSGLAPHEDPFHEDFGKEPKAEAVAPAKELSPSHVDAYRNAKEMATRPGRAVGGVRMKQDVVGVVAKEHGVSHDKAEALLEGAANPKGNAPAVESPMGEATPTTKAEKSKEAGTPSPADAYSAHDQETRFDRWQSLGHDDDYAEELSKTPWIALSEKQRGEYGAAATKDTEPKTRHEQNGWTPENHVKIAADSIDKLRGSHVDRLLDSAPPELLDKMADHIRTNRPDLKDTVDAVHADIKRERKQVIDRGTADQQRMEQNAKDADAIPRVSNDDFANGGWDQAHAGLTSEAVALKMAVGMKGIDGREYGIRQHSPGKWQMVSKPVGAKGEPEAATTVADAPKADKGQVRDSLRQVLDIEDGNLKTFAAHDEGLAVKQMLALRPELQSFHAGEKLEAAIKSAAKGRGVDPSAIARAMKPDADERDKRNLNLLANEAWKSVADEANAADGHPLIHGLSRLGDYGISPADAMKDLHGSQLRGQERKGRSAVALIPAEHTEAVHQATSQRPESLPASFGGMPAATPEDNKTPVKVAPTATDAEEDSAKPRAMRSTSTAQRDIFGGSKEGPKAVKKGQQLSLDDANRDLWDQKAHEYAAEQGYPIEAKELGKFKMNGQWYQVGKQEDGFPITPTESLTDQAKKGKTLNPMAEASNAMRAFSGGGKEKPQVVIALPGGGYGFAGAVDGRLHWQKADGSHPSLEDIQAIAKDASFGGRFGDAKAKQLGLVSRKYATKEEAEKAAQDLKDLDGGASPAIREPQDKPTPGGAEVAAPTAPAEQTKSLQQLRDEHKAKREQREAEFNAKTKELQSQKAKASTRAKKDALDDEYRDLKQKHSDGNSELAAEFYKATENHPEALEERRQTREKLAVKQAAEAEVVKARQASEAAAEAEKPKVLPDSIIDEIFQKDYGQEMASERFKAMPKEQQDKLLADAKARVRRQYEHTAKRITERDPAMLTDGTLDPRNKNSRRVFEHLTGTTLPKTVGETNKVVRDHIGEEAFNAHVDAMAKRHAENKAADAKEKAEREAKRLATPDGQRETASKQLGGYGDDVSPMVRARIVKTLDTNVSHNGVIKTRRDLVRELVGNGFAITKAPDGSDRLQHPDGRFYDAKAMTGTGMSFAKHLIAKGPANSEPASEAIQPATPAASAIATSTQAVAPASAKMKPNTVTMVVRDARGNEVDRIHAPHDGTQESIRQAAEGLTEQAMGYPEFSNMQSRTAASDETGAPRHAVSPNRQNINDIATDAGKYSMGMLDIAPKKEVGDGEKVESLGVPHDELERVGLMRQFGGKWQYRMRSDGKWYHANDKDGAAEMAQKAYSTTPPELRVDGIERGKLADKREYDDMHGKYGHLSVPELQKMADDAKGVKGVAPEKEISDGKRRSGAAMANQGSRDAAEFGMKMGRYIDERKKNDGDDLGGASPALKGPTPKPGGTGAGANPARLAEIDSHVKSLDAYGKTEIGTRIENARQSLSEGINKHGEDSKEVADYIAKLHGRVNGDDMNSAAVAAAVLKWHEGASGNREIARQNARANPTGSAGLPAELTPQAGGEAVQADKPAMQASSETPRPTLSHEEQEKAFREELVKEKEKWDHQYYTVDGGGRFNDMGRGRTSRQREKRPYKTPASFSSFAHFGSMHGQYLDDLRGGTLTPEKLAQYKERFARGKAGNFAEPVKMATPETIEARKAKEETAKKGMDAVNDYMRETLKPGDTVYHANGATVVKRVNPTGITTESGAKFKYDELAPKHATEDRAMTTRELMDLAKSRAETPPTSAPEAESAPIAPTGYSLKDHEGVEDRALSGEMNAEQFREAYKHFRDHEPTLKAELAQQNVTALRKMATDMGGWPRPDDKKADLIDTIYDKMAGQLVPTGVWYSYNPMTTTHIQHLDSVAAKVTDKDLSERAERVKTQRVERDERVKTMMDAIKEPKTYEDFQTFAKLRGEHTMTPEQLATWDNLRADKRREGQKAKRLEDAKVTGFTPGESATGSIGIVEGHHKKRNAPTFTVTIEQHLGDNWGAALERAKRLGGSYVNGRIAKAYGATPGFQFFDRAKADEFAKVLRGETVDQTATVEQREADRIANRAGSLTEKAAAKVAEGQESLGKDRQENTRRRSEQAASARAEAQSKIAHGRTLERIGQAMDAGELKHLNGIKGVTDLHSLNRALQNAKFARYQTESKENPALRYEEFMAQPHSEDDVRNVTYPYPQIWSDDLRTMAKSFADEPGLVRVADKLLKAGNAVNDIKFQTSAGGMKTGGGKLLTARNFADSTQAKTYAHYLQNEKGEESGVRVHASYDYRLVQNAKAQGIDHSGAFYTADKGQTWGVSPEASVAAAISKGKKLDLVPIPQEKLLTLADPDHIEAMRKAARRLRSHSNRDLKRIGENLHDRLEHHDRLKRADITTGAELRAALREYLPLRASSEKENPVKELERKLVGQKIDGFFPTPRPLIERMLDKADIQPGHAVLEPSAGKGDILDAISERHPDANAEGIEPMSSLRSIIEAKGHKLAGHDVMEHSGEYDRVVMNPPFENGQDAQHVQKAYEMLKPGGRLVAVMSAGPFGRSDKKSAGFREWLDTMDHEADDLPDGSFAGSDAFRKTGVRTKLLTINKPA